MTEASVPAEPTRDATQKRPGLVQTGPESDRPDARPKLSAAKGVLIAGGAAAAFWIGVAAVVAAFRH